MSAGGSSNVVQTPSHVSPPTPFNLSLARSSRPTDVRLFDGGRYAWLVCVGILFVVATDTGKCISRLQLTVTTDEPYSVSSSCELKPCTPGARGRKPACLLVLAVDYEGHFYSQFLRTIEFYLHFHLLRLIFILNF